jgi:hypothetical protein
MSETETVTVFGKHTLSEEEITDKSMLMAETVRSLSLKQAEKKSVVKRFGAEIEALAEQVEILSGHVRDGYEMRAVVCIRRKDFDRKLIRFVSVENGDTVKVEPFTEADYQMTLRDTVA